MDFCLAWVTITSECSSRGVDRSDHKHWTPSGLVACSVRIKCRITTQGRDSAKQTVRSYFSCSKLLKSSIFFVFDSVSCSFVILRLQVQRMQTASREDKLCCSPIVLICQCFTPNFHTLSRVSDFDRDSNGMCKLLVAMTLKKELFL